VLVVHAKFLRLKVMQSSRLLLRLPSKHMKHIYHVTFSSFAYQTHGSVKTTRAPLLVSFTIQLTILSVSFCVLPLSKPLAISALYTTCRACTRQILRMVARSCFTLPLAFTWCLVASVVIHCLPLILLLFLV